MVSNRTQTSGRVAPSRSEVAPRAARRGARTGGRSTLILRRSPRLALSTSSPLLALFAPFAVALVVGACGKARDASDENRDEFAGETRDTEMKHEACDPAGKTAKTLKAEGQLDKSVATVTHVYDGGHEVCSFSDINGDGRVDLWTYFDPSGAPRRHEAAYGVDKNVTEVASYKAGELEMVARDTTRSGRVDTWDYYTAGKLVRRERDKNGDGRLDEWWTFEAGSDQATITQADPRTGKPDANTTLKVEVGFVAGAAVASTSPKPSASPKPTPSSSAPTPAAASATPSAAPSVSGSAAPKGKVTP